MESNPNGLDAGSGRSPRGTVSRRSVLLGGASAVAGALAGCSGGGAKHGWVKVGTPTNDALYDGVVSEAGPYAVGNGGTVITREGENWTTAVSDGPAGDGNTLYGTDATDDGRRVWFAGGSGAVGYYDVVADTLTDYSAPNEKTSSWTDVAVGGRARSERVALVNSSGEFLLGRVTADGVRWGSAEKPGGGQRANAVQVAGRVVLVADAGGGVYARKPGGGNNKPRWDSIGISGEDAEIRDLAAPGPNRVSVATTSGTVFAYDGHRWLETEVSDGPLRAISRMGPHALAAGNAGKVYELRDHEWNGATTPTEQTLHGCALHEGSFSDVAVGDDGTVLERFG